MFIIRDIFVVPGREDVYKNIHQRQKAATRILDLTTLGFGGCPTSSPRQGNEFF